MPRNSGPFWALFNTLPVGAVLFDLDSDDFVECNEAACEQLGYTRAAFARLGFGGIDAGRSLDEIRAERRALTLGGPSRRVHTRLRRSDGELRHVDITLQCIELGGRLLGYGVWHDVTDREAAVAALKARELELARVQRIGRVGGYEIDLRNGFDNQRSPEYLRLHGLPADAANEPHEAWVRRLHPEDRERTDRVFRQTLAGDARHYEAEYRVVLPDGRIRWLSSVAEIERDADGKAVRVVGAHIDVTALRHAEHTLARHASQLEEADRRKNEFLAMLGHELRNPLAPILSVIERLRRDDREAAGRWQAYEVIHRQATHLRGLVDELLDIARITTGKIELAREPVDLRTVVATAVEQMRGQIEARAHQLIIGLPAQALSVDGDSARLIQVVANLLDNAAKYTDPGGTVRIAVRPADDDPAVAVIEVADTGRGLPADMLRQVFDLFVQENWARSDAGGLGVGLTLVQRLVELHGGTITAHSDGPGRGSRFVVRLPLRPAAGPDAAVAAAATQAVPRPAPKRLLVVDDNTDAAEAMAELLRLDGHQVLTRADGGGLIELVARFRPAVVILDIGLPGRDGYQLAAELRAGPQGADLVLVALTGYGQDEDQRRSLDAGFDHHFVKPVDSRALARVIAAAGSGR